MGKHVKVKKEKDTRITSKDNILLSLLLNLNTYFRAELKQKFILQEKVFCPTWYFPLSSMIFYWIHPSAKFHWKEHRNKNVIWAKPFGLPNDRRGSRNPKTRIW